MKLRESRAKEERAFVKVARRPGVPKVGVARGYGPRHAENVLEGSVDERVPKARGEEFKPEKVLKLERGSDNIKFMGPGAGDPRTAATTIGAWGDRLTANSVAVSPADIESGKYRPGQWINTDYGWKQVQDTSHVRPGVPNPAGTLEFWLPRGHKTPTTEGGAAHRASGGIREKEAQMRSGIAPATGRARGPYRDLSTPTGPLGMGTRFFETPESEIPRATPGPTFPPPQGGGGGGGEVPSGEVQVGQTYTSGGVEYAPTTDPRNPGYVALSGPNEGQVVRSLSGGSLNPLDYINPFGHTTQGGSGSGVPTQKAVGTVVGTLSNLLLPGSGLISGPMSRWLTNLIQHGASKGQVQQAVARAQGKLPPMPHGSVALPIRGGAAPPVTGGGGYDPFGGLPEGFTETNRFGGGAPIFTPPGFTGPQWSPGGSIFGGTLSRTGWVAGGGSPGNLGGAAPVQAGRYMGAAGMSRPFSAAEYGNLAGQKYAAPALSGASGGVTQRPGYDQYISMWHAPGTAGSSTGPGGAAYSGDLDYQQRLAQQSRHIGQRQNYAQGEGDVSDKEYERRLNEDFERNLRKRRFKPVKGPQFDPKDIPIVPGDEAGNLMFDPELDPEDLILMAKRGKAKVGVAKGFGPRHAENAQEGSTDTVPAMLTPREAVLNRNAAELAGRGEIEKLNEAGNKLAEEGVDLASEGGKTMKQRPRKYQGGVGGVNQWKRAGMEASIDPVGGTPPNQDLSWQHLKNMQNQQSGVGARYYPGANPFPSRSPGGLPAPVSLGGAPVPLPRPGVGVTPLGGGTTLPGLYGGGPFPGRGPGGVYPGGPETPMVGRGIPGGIPGGPPSGTPVAPYPYEVNPMAFPGRGPGGVYPGGAPGYTPLPVPGVGITPFGTPQSGPSSFYPPGQRPRPFQYGTSGVASLGSGGGKAYSDQPVQFNAPDISRLLQGVAKQAGLTPSQTAAISQGILGMIQRQDTADLATAPTGAGYQGGISDIGYPPFIAPGAEYHGDKGSNWLGPYDQEYMIPRYWTGTSSVGLF